MKGNFEEMVDRYMKSIDIQTIGSQGENSFESYQRFLRRLLLSYSQWLERQDKE